MNDTDFHRLADGTLQKLYDALETADRDGALDIEHEDGALHIKMPSGKEWLVSKHGVTRQLWLASPLSGGLHFIYDDTKAQWALPDGRTPESVLSAELNITLD